MNLFRYWSLTRAQKWIPSLAIQKSAKIRLKIYLNWPYRTKRANWYSVFFFFFFLQLHYDFQRCSKHCIKREKQHLNGFKKTPKLAIFCKFLWFWPKLSFKSIYFWPTWLAVPILGCFFSQLLHECQRCLFHCIHNLNIV